MSCRAEIRSAGRASVTQARTNTPPNPGQALPVLPLLSADWRSGPHPSIRSMTACSSFPVETGLGPGIPPASAVPGPTSPAVQTGLGPASLLVQTGLGPASLPVQTGLGPASLPVQTGLGPESLPCPDRARPGIPSLSIPGSA